MFSHSVGCAFTLFTVSFAMQMLLTYLEISLTKDVNDLYVKNSKTLRKEIEEDRSKWKHIFCSWIGKNNITRMTVLPKAIYRFNAIPIRYQ